MIYLFFIGEDSEAEDEVLEDEEELEEEEDDVADEEEEEPGVDWEAETIDDEGVGSAARNTGIPSFGIDSSNSVVTKYIHKIWRKNANYKEYKYFFFSSVLIFFFICVPL